MKKSPDAFRTISEVAEWLDVPTHVLRFWESRFAQVKPVKRAGGRRYYRPSDMLLIGGIKRLLHDDGMTIRAVQKLLREEGVRHVSGFSQPLDMDEDGAVIDATAASLPEEAEGESDVISLLREAAETDAPAPAEPEAEVVSFGSVRTSEPELPLGAAEEEEDADIAAPAPTFRHRDPGAEDAPARPPAPQEDTDRAAPVAETGRIPETPDVPLTDAPDDAPEHPATPGAVARLITRDPRRPLPEDVRIEQVVEALRAVRDRSPS